MLYNITWHMLYNTTWQMSYNITWHMLYNTTWHMLYNTTCHMLYNTTCHMLCNIWHNICYIFVLFCSVRTLSLADIQALVFLLIHSQNVNWITRAQINPRREKRGISFYINQFHLWNNCMFLERIWVFFLFYSVHVSLFVYLFSFICIYLF